MNPPFFSIIIPTRNRYETLKYSILTVLNQGYRNYELIICDNSDEACLPELAQISEQLSDSRVKYCRPDSVLSMTDNWEFAVSKATGNYIIIFGDDDGLVMDSLEYIHAIIQKTKAEIVSWARIEYSWPDRKPAQIANLMIIPHMSKSGLINSRQFIKKVVHREADYRFLPMFYNSAVSKNMVALLKAKSGRVFHSACPDIYSGYAFAHLAKQYLSISYPLSINGVSSKSNGAAHLNNDESAKADYWKTFRTSSIKWPTSIPEINTVYMGIAEPFVQAGLFFPEFKSYISLKGIYKFIIDSLEAGNEEDLNNKIEKVKESAKNDPDLYKWVVGYLLKAPLGVANSDNDDHENIEGFYGSHLYLNGLKFGLQNVYDVSVFIRNLFGDLKEDDFSKPVYLPLIARLKKAASIILRN